MLVGKDEKPGIMSLLYKCCQLGQAIFKVYEVVIALNCFHKLFVSLLAPPKSRPAGARLGGIEGANYITLITSFPNSTVSPFLTLRRFRKSTRPLYLTWPSVTTICASPPVCTR